MMNLIDLINYALVSAGLTISILGLFLSFRLHIMDRITRSFFICFFLILTIYTASDLVSQTSLLFFGPEYRILSQIAVFLESLASSVLMPLLTLFLLYCCEEDWKRSPVFYITFGLWTLYFLLLIITQFTTSIYYIDSANIYHRGPLYAVLLVPPVLLMLTNLIALIIRRNKLVKKLWDAFIVFLIIPLISMLFQMWLYGLLLIVIGTTISTLIMFLLIVKYQEEQFLQQEISQAKQDISIKMLQIRPHFIYNTMSSIYYLCELDPKKAQKVVGDFTTYLRKNFTAIAKDELIPFEEELEHTKAYLAVEKARYEKLLFVEYDTAYSSFRLPPLTLQPIAENAIKHGMDPEREPLHIFIRTIQEENGARIIVEDTGPGFDSALTEELPGDNNSSHIGLKNVKDRIEMMSHGSLEISSEEGSTRVTVWVPTQSQSIH